MKKILFLLLFCATTLIAQAQELNATVTVNSSKVQGSKEIFADLEDRLRIFINNRNWSGHEFQSNELINCSFTIIINEMVSDNSFNAELLVRSSRPIFNSNYSTTMLNFRDTNLSFDYYPYQPIEFNESNIQSNLSATIAFYVYLILGLDFDSMSELGGNPYFQSLNTIANNVQSNNWSGWEPFGTNKNRYAIAQAFNDMSFVSYRQMWYKYHRLGLDEMSDNIEQGTKEVIAAFPVLASIYEQRPNSVLLTLFGDAKLDELVNIYSKATQRERIAAYDGLLKIYPTRTSELNKIRLNHR